MVFGDDAHASGRDPGERAVLLEQAPSEGLERRRRGPSPGGGDVTACFVRHRVEGEQGADQLRGLTAPDLRERQALATRDDAPVSADERRKVAPRLDGRLSPGTA